MRRLLVTLAGIALIVLGGCSRPPTKAEETKDRSRSPKSQFGDVEDWARTLDLGREERSGPPFILGAEAGAGDSAIRFTLRNAAATPVTLETAFLPWADSPFISFMAIAESGRILKVIIPRSDPAVFKSVTLASGQALDGSMELSDRIPELRAVSGREKVVVFWAYHPRAEGMAPSPASVGSVAFGPSAPN